ncbi:NnrU family protein [Croceicoccus mobilis]|uniref:NnrU domain-containing protein n=1 Tax=Croceicoccus mobilis TaxID=1703339 RepID=A0A917DRB3_9SPHN|nr:NnrU family protein [Croceicoccus mobilis]GGD61286.1 hypothetical protein GCM10010990_08490 [Croceicoccus mobilis]
MVLTFLALLLLTGGIMRNPAAPSPNGEELAATREADGAFAVTRHPVMWGIALWALSHILLAPDLRTLFFMGAMIVLALGGSAAQDHKKREFLGEGWKVWAGKTSYFPQLSQLGQIRPVMWLVSLALWLAISWLHLPLGGIPAGVWRWVG